MTNAFMRWMSVVNELLQRRRTAFQELTPEKQAGNRPELWKLTHEVEVSFQEKLQACLKDFSTDDEELKEAACGPRTKLGKILCSESSLATLRPPPPRRNSSPV